jgi:hypothetical protein
MYTVTKIEVRILIFDDPADENESILLILYNPIYSILFQSVFFKNLFYRQPNPWAWPNHWLGNFLSTHNSERGTVYLFVPQRPAADGSIIDGCSHGCSGARGCSVDE